LLNKTYPRKQDVQAPLRELSRLVVGGF